MSGKVSKSGGKAQKSNREVHDVIHDAIRFRARFLRNMNLGKMRIGRLGSAALIGAIDSFISDIVAGSIESARENKVHTLNRGAIAAYVINDEDLSGRGAPLANVRFLGVPRPVPKLPRSMLSYEERKKELEARKHDVEKRARHKELLEKRKKGIEPTAKALDNAARRAGAAFLAQEKSRAATQQKRRAVAKRNSKKAAEGKVTIKA